MKDRLVALAVLVAALSVARLVSPALAAACLVLPVLAVALGPRLRLDRLAQVAATLGAMLGGVVAARQLANGAQGSGITELSDQVIVITLPILGVAGMRALIERPHYGSPVTLAAALVVLTAGGRAISGPAYPLLCAAFLALAFLGLAATDPGRAPARLGSIRHRATVIGAVVAALAFSISATLVLPGLQDAAMRRFLERFRWARTGFGNQLELGSMTGMLEDRRVVMRLRGVVPTPLLRGAVYTQYAHGEWVVPLRLPVAEVLEVETAAPLDAGVGVEIENARAPERYFLPLEASDVRVSSGYYSRDLLNVHRPIAGFDAKRVWFTALGGRAPLPPLPTDTVMPVDVAPRLVALLHRWGVDPRLPTTERLRRIEARLRADYAYSLEFDRDPTVDPVLDFLERQRTGHCEYFASAFALLGRATAVPTRVVTGYRVAEASPLGYHVVRERHAHAWVEAWVDGTWVTYDPTPPAGLSAAMPSTTPWAAALEDGIATTWQAVDDWLRQRTPFELSSALIGLVGVYALSRAFARRRVRRRRVAAPDPPLPGFLALSRALERRGLVREPQETLAAFATRVGVAPRLSTAERDALAALFARYAELRYADRGDSDDLDARLADAARKLRAAVT